MTGFNQIERSRRTAIYIRISTSQQQTDRQETELKEFFITFIPVFCKLTYNLRVSRILHSTLRILTGTGTLVLVIGTVEAVRNP